MTMQHDKSISIPRKFVQISATTVGTDTTLSAVAAIGNRPVRGLLIGTAGYLDVTMEDGSEALGLPFQAGINPGAFAVVQESTGGGAASNVWAIL